MTPVGASSRMSYTEYLQPQAITVVGTNVSNSGCGIATIAGTNDNNSGYEPSE
jgi:hypothetical protein